MALTTAVAQPLNLSNTSFTETQLRIFDDRYALRDPLDPNKILETSPKDMWKRVASWASSQEKDSAKWFDRFYEILEDFRFVPGGRILHSAGSSAEVTGHNCFVLPYPEDSRRGILESLNWWVETQARGGGVGINMSSLRPSGEVVKGVHGTSSGPIPWMELFTTSTSKVVIQGGSRRGAAMIMLADWHPDVLQFIAAKKTPGVLEGANLSVTISDEFMLAVKNEGTWDLKWGDKVYQTIEAKELWDMIVESAWSSGEPGCFWIDRANTTRNLWYLPDMEFICTNPCAEIPLPAYGACNLGTINVSAFISQGTVNWDDLKKTVWRAVRFLDNVIDLSFYPLPQYKKHQETVRQEGLGITGLADALIKLKIPYGSPTGVAMTEEFYKTVCEEAYRESIRLARDRGMFPACIPEKHAIGGMITKLPDDIKQGVLTHGIRNSYLTAQQPSGTQSLLAGVNSGIEPVFDFEAIRKDRTGEYKPTSEATILAKVARNGSSTLPDYFVSANDLGPKDHVSVQAAAQRWIDQSVSKTVNAPNDYTIEQVDLLYRFAYESGLRTIAFYRDGSRDQQVLYHPSDGGISDATTPSITPKRIKLDTTRKSITHRFQVGEQEGYVTVGLYPDGSPGELFITMSKEGSTARGLIDAFATAISIALQHGVDIEYLTDKFSGSKFEPSGMTLNKDIPAASSVIDYIFRWLKNTFMSPAETPAKARNGHLCTNCGGMLINQEGCELCESCGYSKCS